MSKPELRNYYDFQECSRYIEHKYKVDSREYMRWIFDIYDRCANGIMIKVNCLDDLEYLEENEDEEMSNIITIWQKEFANEDGEINLLLWW